MGSPPVAYRKEGQFSGHVFQNLQPLLPWKLIRGWIDGFLLDGVVGIQPEPHRL